MNKFEAARNYFIHYRIKENITRKEYLYYMYDIHNIGEVTCDNCRCILMTAGYLKRVKRGVYRKIKHIPNDLTYTMARKQAYGKETK